MAATTGFLSLICAVLATSVSGSIVTGPLNDAQYFGGLIVLRCNASVSTSRVLWTEYVTNKAGAPINDGTDILQGHPNAPRYAILHPSPTEYDLQINQTVLVDGGTYRCEDLNEGNPAYAQIIMIAAPPNCTTNIPSTGYVREDQYYTAECTIDYRGNTAPLITWTGPPVQYGQAGTTTNTTVWKAVGLNMTRYSNNYAFSAHVNFTDITNPPNSATNIPNWNYTYTTAVLYVQWAPKTPYIVPEKNTYEVGDVLECHSDANPSETTFWQNMDSHEYWYDYRLTVTDRLVGTQLMRCNARNNISNVEYSANYFFNMTVNPRTTTPIPTTPSTTTPPPAEAPCDDLTGKWGSDEPHEMEMCLEVNNTNQGRILGIVRNASDPYFIEVRGRVAPNKFNQVGFTGIWPVNIGVITFTGICKKCLGVEMLWLNGITRRIGDNLSCENVGMSHTHPSYLFTRTGPPCRDLAEKARQLHITNY